MSGQTEDPASKRACPICDKPAKQPHFPFCSSRCKTVDLNRWLSSSYTIAGNQSDDESEGLGPEDIDPGQARFPTEH